MPADLRCGYGYQRQARLAYRMPALVRERGAQHEVLSGITDGRAYRGLNPADAVIPGVSYNGF
jgi:hypothetical protein